MSMEEKIVEDKIIIPNNVSIKIENCNVIVKGELGEIKEDFSHASPIFILQGNELIIKIRGKGKRAKALLGTITSLIKNMIIGVSKGYTYKLKVVSSHFPVSVKVSGNMVLIENFLGEKYVRKAKIVGENTKVIPKGEDIIVTGINKYEVSQTAANIEKAVRIKKKDPRKFLDGIYVYEKQVGILK
jgi:large subunit ribosomal protein L6